MHTAHTPEWPELLRPWELPLAKPALPAGDPGPVHLVQSEYL